MKIRLRRLKKEDARVSVKWRNDKEIWKFTGSKPDRKITEEMEINWITEVLRRKDEKRFAICVNSNEKYIGNVQLTNIADGKAQLHIFIGDKNYWGRGIATNATKQIVRYAFNYLKLKEVYLFVKEKNLAAVKVYLKCGFKISRVKNNGEIQMIIQKKSKK